MPATAHAYTASDARSRARSVHKRQTPTAASTRTGHPIVPAAKISASATRDPSDGACAGATTGAGGGCVSTAALFARTRSAFLVHVTEVAVVHDDRENRCGNRHDEDPPRRSVQGSFAPPSIEDGERRQRRDQQRKCADVRQERKCRQEKNTHHREHPSRQGKE